MLSQREEKNGAELTLVLSWRGGELTWRSVEAALYWWRWVEWRWIDRAPTRPPQGLGTSLGQVAVFRDWSRITFWLEGAQVVEIGPFCSHTFPKQRRSSQFISPPPDRPSVNQRKIGSKNLQEDVVVHGLTGGELNFRSDFLRVRRDAPTQRLSSVCSRYGVHTNIFFKLYIMLTCVADATSKGVLLKSLRAVISGRQANIVGTNSTRPNTATICDVLQPSPHEPEIRKSGLTPTLKTKSATTAMRFLSVLRFARISCRMVVPTTGAEEESSLRRMSSIRRRCLSSVTAKFLPVTGPRILLSSPQCSSNPSRHSSASTNGLVFTNSSTSEVMLQKSEDCRCLSAVLFDPHLIHDLFSQSLGLHPASQSPMHV